MKFQIRGALVVSPLVALLGALTIMLALTASAAAWSGAVYVTTNGANDNDAAVDPTNGHVHMAWYDGTTDYWYAECNPAANTCTQPVDISVQAGARPVLPTFATTEALRPGVAVDSNGNTYVGFPNPAVGPNSGGITTILKKSENAGSFSTFKTLGSGWQVRLAMDPFNRLHVVWGSSGILSYAKFDSSGNQLANVSNFSNGDGQGSHLAADAGGNAHIVYEGNLASPKMIDYVKIGAAGNASGVKTVYSDPNGYNSINPDVAVDVNGKLHLAWRDSNPNNIQILYQRCDAGTLANCTAVKTINTDGVMGDDVSITTIGTNYFIAYQQQMPEPTNARFMMVYFGQTGQLQQVDGNSNEFWASIRGNPATGDINLVYRYAPGDGTFNLLFRHQNCNCANVSPTPTSTATLTPTQTMTPTTGPSPTATSTRGAPPPHGTPVNLSKDFGAANDHAPSVALDGRGDIVVAWQHDSGGSTVLARTALGGDVFGAKGNVGGNSPPSLEPYLFAAGSTQVYALMMSGSPYDIYDSILSGGGWLALTNLTNGGGIGSQDGVGVQAADGNIWVAFRQSSSDLSNNTFAQELGGNTYQLSNSGSASPHPAIAAGAGGIVYVAWTDKGPSGTGCCIMVSEWNGRNWAVLPNATNSIAAVLPSLAFSNGKLYVVWQEGAFVNERIWNGSNWSPILRVNSGGTAPRKPKIFIPASGDIFVAWSDSGVVYLSKNGGTRRAVSGTVTKAKEPALFVDNDDVPYIVFDNGDVWYVANP